MHRFVLAAAAAALLATPVFTQQAPGAQPSPSAGPNTWQVDPVHTAAHFSVKHMMVSTVRGTLGRVTGTIEYDGRSAGSLKADISIDVAGVTTGNDSRDNDLRSPNFFEVAKYPAMTFRSTRVEAAGQGTFKLTGDLTMHGVTKAVTLDVEGPSPILKQANGGERVGASATTTLNRRDFGLQYNRMIEAAPIVGDDIQVQIDIEATRKK